MSVEEEQNDLERSFEARLQAELRNQLEAHIGRSVPYFLARCGPKKDRRGWRRIVVGAAAVAACCAAFIAWRQTRPAAPVRPHAGAAVSAAPGSISSPGPTRDDTTPSVPAIAAPGKSTVFEGDGSEQAPPTPGRTAVPQPHFLGRAVSARTRDEGILLVGRTPVRKLRRQWLERVEWFDPQNGARVRRIVPHEEVLFVPLSVN